MDRTPPLRQRIYEMLMESQNQACNCGSDLPVLLRIDDRQDPIFRFPDRLASYVADADVTPRAKTKINKHLREIVHPKLNFGYRRLTEIPRSAGGKQQRFVREIP